jgi:DNA-binding HxlR family transcriptional regulator
MKKRGDDTRTRCSVESVISMIGGRWKCVVLFHLLRGTRRFGELRRALPNVTQRVLTLSLRELEEDGLVQRTVYAEVPPRVEYALTPWGRSLEPILIAMREWGDRYKLRLQELAPEPAPRRARAAAPRPLS